MTAVLSKTPPTSPPPPRVTWSDGVLELRDERTFGPGGEAPTARFLSRVFRVEGVVSVTVDRARSTATIRHEPVSGGRSGLLTRLAEAVRGRAGNGPPTPFVRGLMRGPRTEFHRGPVLPACRVMFDGPGRLRLRLDTLKHKPDLAQRLERLLETVPGVQTASAGPWLGRLLVKYDAAVLPRERLLELIGLAFHGPDVWSRRLPEPGRVRSNMANATLGVAALGEYAVPALVPVSALLLVATNLRTFWTAYLQVRQRRFGLPVLYTAIVATTLASGQFVSSALMTWFFRYWDKRYRRDLVTGQHRFLDSCLPLPGTVRLLTAGGTEVLVGAEHVRPGDRVIASAGEAVPADGRVLRGAAVVDERSLRGTEGATRKRPNDHVLAGSRVLSGEIVIWVECPVEDTLASALGRSLVAATNPTPGLTAPTLRSERFAERAVGPSLATAGVGFLVGDLATVSTILRPDYATGPGVSVSLEFLRGITRCARRGVVVHDPSALERLGRIDLIVLEDHPALGRVGLEVSGVATRADEDTVLRYAASAYRHLDDPRSRALSETCLARSIHLLDLPPVDLKAGVTVRHGRLAVRVREQSPGRDGDGPLVVEVDGSAVAIISFRRSARPESAAVLNRLRGAGPLRVVLVSDRPAGEVAPLAAALGVNQVRGGLDPAGKAAFVRSCRERGRKPAFVGDCRRNVLAAEEATVAIAPSDDSASLRSPGAAAVQVLGDRLGGLELLWDTARSLDDRVRRDHAFVVAPNLLCVAGAFLFGFNGMTAVALSNLGTYGVYSRAAGSLRASDGPDRLRPRPSWS